MSNINKERLSEHEMRKIAQGVFDKSTLIALNELIRKDVLDELKSIVSTGKEANVYHGIKGSLEVAVKIYSIEASDFRKMDLYIKGDHRFTEARNRRQLVYNWARKEYNNLKRVAGEIKAPKPLAVEKNILVMEFIGRDGIPAPRLKDLPPEKPKPFLEDVLNSVKKMYSLGIVHGDLSEYNILNWDDQPYIIDYSMGVLLDHPMADELLRRDLRNVLNFFRKVGVVCQYCGTEGEAYRWVTEDA